MKNSQYNISVVYTTLFSGISVKINGEIMIVRACITVSS